MTRRIEDYALVGDGHTAALVGMDGSIDWLCLPRFDSSPCFASLLGTPEHGCFRLAPKGVSRATRRRYRAGTLVLETDFESDGGAVTVIDAMPPRERTGGKPHVVRVVEGRRGRVTMEMSLVLRFDYGSIVPWVRTVEGELRAIGGPDAVRLATPVSVRGRGLTSVSEFEVAAGERVPFTLSWHRSYDLPPPLLDPFAALEQTTSWWERWSGRCAVDGPWSEAIVRPMITLKALADPKTGGIVAAPTTSLPEEIGGARNWDYRFCWVRDATFTLLALLHGGYVEEATAWRGWLLRAVAGSPGELQIMYGLGGERRLTESTIPWLPGFEGSSPVRVGNAASAQLQLDVYGELMDCMYNCQKHGVPADEASWQVQLALMNALERLWPQADEGLWEVRGGRQHFTHSKIMAWVAFDRAIKTVESFGCQGPVAQWRETRRRIHDEVCREGYSAKAGAFTQRYGSDDLDAALLLLPHVGFLPVTGRARRRHDRGDRARPRGRRLRPALQDARIGRRRRRAGQRLPPLHPVARGLPRLDRAARRGA